MFWFVVCWGFWGTVWEIVEILFRIYGKMLVLGSRKGEKREDCLNRNNVWVWTGMTLRWGKREGIVCFWR
ncbi:MAG: hypothetical protein ACTS4U_01555 [Candidatus Hodgkinia cicadicola]